MSISKFALITDSMGSKLTLPNTKVFAYSGARPKDRRVIECINSMSYGDYEQAILFLGGNSLKQWNGAPAIPPAMVNINISIV